MRATEENAAREVSHAAAQPRICRDADQGEEPTRGIVVDIDLAGEPLLQQVGAFVMQAAPAHIDGLDLRRRRGLDCRVVALADGEIVLHHAAEWSQRQHHLADRRIATLPADIEDQAAFFDREMQVVGPARTAVGDEPVFLDQVKIATARSCSTSALRRTTECSSRKTLTMRWLSRDAGSLTPASWLARRRDVRSAGDGKAPEYAFPRICKAGGLARGERPPISAIRLSRHRPDGSAAGGSARKDQNPQENTAYRRSRV